MAIQYFNWARTKNFCRFFSQTNRKIYPRFVNTNEGEGRQTECLNSSLNETFMMMRMYEFVSVCFILFTFWSLRPILALKLAKKVQIEARNFFSSKTRYGCHKTQILMLSSNPLNKVQKNHPK
jgi:hypothetical protein